MDSKKMDKWDYLIATGSGAMTGAMDVLFVKDISLAAAQTAGKEDADKFILKIAKKKGFKGSDNELADAVKHLEKEYPISADSLKNVFGGGGYHHLRDFSHHPTIIGLMFSIISQFTGNGYGTDKQGNFKSVSMKEKGFKRQGLIESIYTGTIKWLFHMISDIDGSSETIKKGKDGTGIPGPIMALLKELSAVPGIKRLAGKTENKGTNGEYNYNFSEMSTRLFRGKLLGEYDENGELVKGTEIKFDLRTEIGIVDKAIENKQYVPVLLNEIIVRAIYSVRRFVEEIRECNITNLETLKTVSMENVLPMKGKRLTHMLTLSNLTFSTLDISTAYVKAKLKNKDDKTKVALDFMQGINYAGLVRLTLSTSTEFGLGVDKACRKCN